MARDLLARQADQGQVCPGAAVLLRHPQLHQAHVAVDLEELGREAVGLVDLGGDRGDVTLGHPPDAVAEGELLFGEVHRGFREELAVELAPLFNGATIPLLKRNRTRVKPDQSAGAMRHSTRHLPQLPDLDHALPQPRQEPLRCRRCASAR